MALLKISKRKELNRQDGTTILYIQGTITETDYELVVQPNHISFVSDEMD